MPATSLWLLAAIVTGPIWADTSGNREAQSYSAASIVNAADNLPGPLAPNTFASIYGANLAFVTRAVKGEDISGGFLPTVLPGTGLRVLINNYPANMYYVSPTQINVLIPAILIPGPAQIQLVLNAQAGPVVTVTLAAASPALFELDQQTVVATRPDGSVVTQDNPAHRGEWVILYATGLGTTVPPAGYGEIATSAAPLKSMATFQVLLDGVAVDPSRIPYAGLTPGFAGLYQVNLLLPDDVGPNPEVRLITGDPISPEGIHIPVQP